MGFNTKAVSFLSNGGESLSDAFTGFNELTVSSATPLIDLKSIYGVSNLRDRVEVTGSGAVTSERGLYKVSTGTTGTSTAKLSSAEYGRYIAGFESTPGLGIMLSRMPTGNEVGRWGYYTDNDGFGFGVDVDGFFVFLRSGGVETVVRQENWRRGNITFDFDNIIIYRMPFLWYGSGPVRFEIAKTLETGRTKLETLHTISAADGEPICEDPNLPLVAEVDNGGDPTDFSLFVGGRQFFVQGNYNPNRRITAEHRFSTSVGTTFVPLVSWRQKDAFDSVSVKLEGANLLSASANILYEIRVGSTLTGASFSAPTNVDASETALEFDKVATAVSGGQKIFAGLLNAGTGNSAGASQSDFPKLDLPKDQVLTLCARSVSGTATVSSVLKAREEW